MKIVLDSNILVAAFAARGLCSSLLELCLDRYEIIISNYILDEVYRALEKKIKLPRDKADAVMKYLKEYCKVSSYSRIASGVCRDKKDDDIIALAVSNRARYIITGDDDLLSLKKYEEVEIVSPRVFWSRVKIDKG